MSVRVTIGDRPKDRRNLIFAMRARGLIPRGELAKVLSPREYEVMVLRAKGFTTFEVAAMLGIAVTTVRTHCRNAYIRLDVDPDTQGQAAVWTTFIRALTKLGWLTVPDEMAPA